jgi:hypothetical protein
MTWTEHIIADPAILGSKPCDGHAAEPALRTVEPDVVGGRRAGEPPMVFGRHRE